MSWLLTNISSRWRSSATGETVLMPNPVVSESVNGGSAKTAGPGGPSSAMFTSTNAGGPLAPVASVEATPKVWGPGTGSR